MLAAALALATSMICGTRAELCGEPSRFGSSKNGCSTRNSPEPNGSTHQASMPAENSGCVRRCSYRAAWSTIAPRATLTRTAAGLSRPSSRGPISPRVLLVSGRAITTTSAAPSTASRSSRVPTNSTGSSVRPLVLTAWTRAPSARSSRPVAFPMPPKPRMAQTAPATGRLTEAWSQTPAASSAWCCGSRLSRASVMATACSAIGSA
jgi:hypothetical protein